MLRALAARTAVSRTAPVLSRQAAPMISSIAASRHFAQLSRPARKAYGDEATICMSQGYEDYKHDKNGIWWHLLIWSSWFCTWWGIAEVGEDYRACNYQRSVPPRTYGAKATYETIYENQKMVYDNENLIEG